MNAPGWTAAPPGRTFEGIALDRGRWDPYWVLGDASGYGDYVNPGSPASTDATTPPVDARLPALVELRQGCTAEHLRDWLRRSDPAAAHMPDVYTTQRHVTAWVGPDFLAATAPGGELADVVERAELGLPLVPARTVRPWRDPQALATLKVPTTASPRIVFGVIDTGCAFAHQRLRGPQGTRVRCIWDQESQPARVAFPGRPAPADLGYGREVWRDELNDWIAGAGQPVDESRCYELAGLTMLRRARSHGMHVLDLLCGPVPPSQRMTATRADALTLWQAAHDAATAADVVFVQLPRGALEDASGGWLCVHVLDALRYIVARTEDDEQVIVNLSYGSQLGPHDGSTTLETAIQALCDEVPRLQVVFSAGNSFDRRAHARVELHDAEPSTLTWHLPPDNATAAFAELWLPSGAGITVELTPPPGQGPSSGAVAGGSCVQWRPDPQAMPLADICHLPATACGDGQMVLLRVGPTGGRRKPAAGPWHRTAAPCGDWTVTLRRVDALAPSTDAPAVTVDLYLSRNDPDLDQLRGSRNAHWKDGDRAGRLRPARDDTEDRADPLDPPRQVLRRGSLNWCFPTADGDGRHPQLFVIGGHVLRPEPATGWLSAHPAYASAGPSRGNGPIAPRASLPSEESPALPGIRAAGNRSGGSFRLIGTSVSSPQYARWLALNAGRPPAAGDLGGPPELFGLDGRLPAP